MKILLYIVITTKREEKFYKVFIEDWTYLYSSSTSSKSFIRVR